MTMDGAPVARQFSSQRLRLNYFDWGNDAAPPLVLVHGGRDHARSWDWVARALRGRYRVITPDLRGHGDSDWSPDGAYVPPLFLFDLAQLLEEIGAKTVRLVGHSLGGSIVVRYAGLYPERVERLVAIEGIALGPQDADADRAATVVARWHRWIEQRRTLSGRAPQRYASIEAAEARMQAANPALDAARVGHLTLHGVRCDADGRFSWKFDPYLRAFGPDETDPDEIHALWRRIVCPTLLAYGSDSWASNPAADGRAAYFPNARVELFDGAGHWLHHDRFDQFMKVLNDFL